MFCGRRVQNTGPVCNGKSVRASFSADVGSRSNRANVAAKDAIDVGFVSIIEPVQPAVREDEAEALKPMLRGQHSARSISGRSVGRL